MRLIDADVMIQEINMDIEDVGLQEKMVFYRINEAPSIDVVRCQDCKHRKKNTFCLHNMRYEDDNGFCSFGERKEESGDEDDIQPHACSTCHWCLNDWHQEPCNICAHGSKWKDGR